jgi:transposase-like protein
MGAAWHHCRVHLMRNVLSYVPNGQNTVVAAAISRQQKSLDREALLRTAKFCWMDIAFLSSACHSRGKRG